MYHNKQAWFGDFIGLILSLENSDYDYFLLLEANRYDGISTLKIYASGLDLKPLCGDYHHNIIKSPDIHGQTTPA
jgi:hypothetical protein